VRVSALGGHLKVSPAAPGTERPGTHILVDLPLMRGAIDDDDGMMEAAQ